MARESPWSATAPRLDAVALLRTLRAEGNGFRIVIRGSGLGPRRIMEALRLDVEGLLPDDVSPETLGACLEALSGGARWLAVEVLREVVQDASPAARVLAGLQGLTPRQREIADLVWQGMSNKQIARTLGIAEGTVKFQLHRIFQRTGHRNRALLAAAVALPEVADTVELHEPVAPEPQPPT